MTLKLATIINYNEDGDASHVNGPRSLGNLPMTTMTHTYHQHRCFFLTIINTAVYLLKKIDGMLFK